MKSLLTCALLLHLSPIAFSAEQRWRLVTQGPEPEAGFAGAGELTAVSGKAFFAGWTPASGEELWMADSGGAGQLRELAQQQISSMPRWLHTLNGGVIFRLANLPGSGLWTSDGTPAGTVPLPCPAPQEGTQAAAMSGFLYYHGNDGKWWLTDGTPAGTATVPAMKPSPGWSLAASGSPGIYYTVISAAETELRLFDGVVDTLLHVFPEESGNPQTLVTADGGAVVLMRHGTSEADYWRSGTTPESTELLASAANSQNQCLLSGGALAWFVTHGEDGVADVWSTDGTVAGTRRVLDGSFETWRPQPHVAASATGNRLLFLMEREEEPGQHGRTSVWTTDGTAAGTRLLLDSEYDSEAIPLQITAGGGIMAFTRQGYNAAGPFAEVWRLSPGAATAQCLLRTADLFPDSTGLAADATGRLWLSGSKGNDRLLGSAAMTEDSLPLSPAATGQRKSLESSALRSTPQGLLFRGYTSETGHEPWLSDGTAAGTRMIEDLNTVPNLNVSVPSSFAAGFTAVGGQSYFLAGTPAPALWRTDGTAAGTGIASPLLPGDTDYKLTPSFQALPTGHLLYIPLASELGVMAFTESGGLHPVSPAETMDARFLAASSNRGWLELVTPSSGGELWLTDGTPAGTQIVSDIRPGAESSGIGLPLAVDGRLFFTANDGSHGRELWSSDATPAGTTMLADQTPGAGGTVIGGLAAGPEHLYFTIQSSVSESDAHWEIRRISFAGPPVPEVIARIPMTNAIRQLGTAAISNSVRVRYAAFVSGRYVFFIPSAAAAYGFYHQVWSSGGSPGPASLLPTLQSSRSLYFFHFSLHRGVLYFTANSSSGDLLEMKADAWSTEGTPEGTRLLNSGEGDFFPRSTCAHAGRLFAENNNLMVLNTQPATLAPAVVTASSRTAPVTLTAAALTRGWLDPDPDAPGVVLTAVETGSLFTSRGLAVPGDSTLTGTEQWHWNPPAGAQGSVLAFRLKAWDGQLSAPLDTEVRILLPAWPAAYTAWADASGLQGAERDPLAAPGGDSLANVLKFALGVSAASSAALRLPVAMNSPAALRISRAASAAADVDLFLEESSDLLHWTNQHLNWAGAETGPDLETLTQPLPFGSGQRYYRMRAVLR